MRLTQRTRPPCLVDAAPLTPEGLAGKSRAEIERIALQGWNQTFAVGELFRLTGDDAQDLTLADLDGSLLRVGAGMTSGTLTITGHAGDYAGEQLRGGTLTIRGTAGDYLGAGMRSGNITVSESAGAFCGSARAGFTQGMAGGTIVVRKSVGERAGDRMRRGLMLIEGSAGVYCASRMLAGTIAVLGRVEMHPGYLMRRGTLIFNDPSIAPSATFNLSAEVELIAIRLLLKSIAKRNDAFRPMVQARYQRWLGDLGAQGKGEMLIVDRV